MNSVVVWENYWTILAFLFNLGSITWSNTLCLKNRVLQISPDLVYIAFAWNHYTKNNDTNIINNSHKSDKRFLMNQQIIFRFDAANNMKELRN